MPNYNSMLFFFMYFNIVSILQHAKIAIVFKTLSNFISFSFINTLLNRQLIPGGSALNTARAANWILQNQNLYGKITLFGSIGEDEHGRVLENEL